MTFVTTADGTRIFYKDWGSGQPVVLSHGWPLNADVWDSQAFLLATHGFRAIAHDRRGHGRSSQTWLGNDLDTYAADLAALMEALRLTDAVLVGHSTGGGEIVRYLGFFGTARVAKAVLIGAVAPSVLKSERNPDGLAIGVLDTVRQNFAAYRAGYLRQLGSVFYGCNRPGAAVATGLLDAFWLMGMQADLNAAYRCVRASSETDLSDDLRRIDVPVLVVHGDDDQIVPFRATALRSAELLPYAQLRIHPGAPHGLAGAYEQAVNADLLTFLTS